MILMISLLFFEFVKRIAGCQTLDGDIFSSNLVSILDSVIFSYFSYLFQRSYCLVCFTNAFKC